MHAETLNSHDDSRPDSYSVDFGSEAPNSDLNVAVDFWGGSLPPENPPQNAPGNSSINSPRLSAETFSWQ